MLRHGRYKGLLGVINIRFLWVVGVFGEVWLVFE